MAYNDVYVKTLQKGKDGATWHNGTVSRPISGSSDYQSATDGSGKTIAAVKGDLLFETNLCHFFVWDGSKWKYLSRFPHIDATLTEEGEAADAKATGDRIGAISEEPAICFTDDVIKENSKVVMIRLSATEMQISTPSGPTDANRFWRLWGGEHEASLTRDNGTGVFPAGTYTFTWSKNKTIDLNLYAVPEGVPYTGDSRRKQLASGTPFTMTGPFTVAVRTSNGVNYGGLDDPTILTVNATVSSAVDFTARARLKELTRDVPENQGMRNAYKRALQLTNLAYFTAGDLPDARGGRLTIIPDGTWSSGIPYARGVEKNALVGLNVSVLSYMTAVHNPYSALYTEIVSDDTNASSAYGIDYRQYHDENHYTAMGVVCSAFTSYVLGLLQSYDSDRTSYLERIGVLEKAPDQSYTGVKPLDLLRRDQHVAMVIDVYRDSRGVPAEIVVAESTRPFTRTVRYSAEEFEGYLRGLNDTAAEVAPYTIYRRADGFRGLASSDYYRETPWIPMPGETWQDYKYYYHKRNSNPPPDYNTDTIDESPYVPAEQDNEGNPTGELEYNGDICTFMGDHATYRDHDLIVLNFNKGNYETLVITRGGQAVRTVALPERSGCHAIVLTTDISKDGLYGDEVGIGADDNYYVYLAPGVWPDLFPLGIYTAYLTGDGAESGPTTWQVRSMNIYLDETGPEKVLTVGFYAGTGLRPISVMVCTQSGMQRAIVDLTDEDVANGYKTFNVPEAAAAFGSKIYDADTEDGKWIGVSVQYRFRDTAGFPLTRSSIIKRLERDYKPESNSGTGQTQQSSEDVPDDDAD